MRYLGSILPRLETCLAMRRLAAYKGYMQKAFSKAIAFSINKSKSKGLNGLRKFVEYFCQQSVDMTECWVRQ